MDSQETHSQVMKRADDKAPYHSPFHGYMFQLKLLLFFMCRGLTSGYSFNLGTEIEEAGKFDDLVFEFTQDGKKCFRLLQAKHKFDNTRSFITTKSLLNAIKSEFYLPKYFFSYLDAKKESLFRRSIIKDVIICTNINFDDKDLKTKDIKILLTNKDDILDIKMGNLTKPIRYKFTENIIPKLKKTLNDYKLKLKKVLSDYNDDDIKDFINHLVFAVEFPSEQELEEIIKKEIEKQFHFLSNIFSVEDTYCRFMKTMLDWFQRKVSGRFISDEECKQFFEKAKKGIPVLFNIRSPVESFTGRTKKLDDLHKLLKGPNDKTQTVCITGIGGVGKTELARKYISEFGMEYNNNVLWLNAQSHQALEASFRSLASDKLGISSKNADGEYRGLTSIIEDVYSAFSNRNCLIVFDNAQHYLCKNEFDDGINRFLPSSSVVPKPYILITSRNQKWPQKIHVLPLDMFTKEEAIQFISQILKTDIDESSALANEMQYFPLALQQAVSFIRVRNMKLQNIGSFFNITCYLNLLKEKSKDALNFSFPEDSDIDYTNTVYITWNITLDLIRKSENGEEALEIMNILSYMAPEDVPVEIFLNVMNDDALSSALGILKQYSMISIHHKIISIEQEVVVVNVHRLVQEVIRLKMVEEKKNKSVLEKALLIFKERENVNNKTLNHAISLWNYSSEDGILPEDRRRYCSLVSTYISIELLISERYTELTTFGQTAIALSSTLPMNDIMVQNCLLSLKQHRGIALQILGKYKCAEQSFLEALLHSETMYGKKNSLSSFDKGRLADTLIMQGNYGEAINLCNELIENYPLFWPVKATLAKALISQGKVNEATNILKEIRENLNQSESNESKEILACIFQLEGKYEDALCLYQSLGYRSENKFRRTLNIAQLYLAQKKYPEALNELKGVLNIGRKIF
ncbi:uncharacterized protein, partial [Halyomorpha halys]|uniref:uncharacterized protein n=1 Tax=Halyomorpha halys TaxID=286706 RepID=UPI0034D1FD2D